MKLYAVRVFVHDWDAAFRFYSETLGLEVKFNAQDKDMGWAEFDIGGPSLGLERVGPDDSEGSQLVGRFLGISLQVEDIQDCYDTLHRKGVIFTQAPEKQEWGGSLAHFKDPEGNILTLLG